MEKTISFGACDLDIVLDSKNELKLYLHFLTETIEFKLSLLNSVGLGFSLNLNEVSSSRIFQEGIDYTGSSVGFTARFVWLEFGFALWGHIVLWLFRNGLDSRQLSLVLCNHKFSWSLFWLLWIDPSNTLLYKDTFRVGDITIKHKRGLDRWE
jgi:hypothetical protein